MGTDKEVQIAGLNRQLANCHKGWHGRRTRLEPERDAFRYAAGMWKVADLETVNFQFTGKRFEQGFRNGLPRKRKMVSENSRSDCAQDTKGCKSFDPPTVASARLTRVNHRSVFLVDREVVHGLAPLSYAWPQRARRPS